MNSNDKNVQAHELLLLLKLQIHKTINHNQIDINIQTQIFKAHKIY